MRGVLGRARRQERARRRDRRLLPRLHLRPRPPPLGPPPLRPLGPPPRGRRSPPPCTRSSGPCSCHRSPSRRARDPLRKVGSGDPSARAREESRRPCARPRKTWGWRSTLGSPLTGDGARRSRSRPRRQRGTVGDLAAARADGRRHVRAAHGRGAAEVTDDVGAGRSRRGHAPRDARRDHAARLRADEVPRRPDRSLTPEEAAPRSTKRRRRSRGRPVLAGVEHPVRSVHGVLDLQPLGSRRPAPALPAARPRQRHRPRSFAAGRRRVERHPGEAWTLAAGGWWGVVAGLKLGGRSQRPAGRRSLRVGPRRGAGGHHRGRHGTRGHRFDDGDATLVHSGAALGTFVGELGRFPVAWHLQADGAYLGRRTRRGPRLPRRRRRWRWS